jgi:hypothetical protein
MNPAATFCRWNSLNSVSTRFVLQCVYTLALHLKANGVEPARGGGNIQSVTLSILANRKALVSLGKLTNEELCIIAAFSSTYFEDDR